MKATYAKARADFEYLESVAELSDQIELDARRLELMQTPTKAKAGDMYWSGITLWFSEHGSDHNEKVAAIEEFWAFQTGITG